MFINLKINTKLIITILSIIFSIILIFGIYKVFSNTNTFKSTNNDPNIIRMNTTNYTNILKELDLYLDNYVGHKISVNGFVFRNEDFEKDKFVIARNMIICCESDPAVVGIMCKLDKASNYPNDTWVEIKGTLDKYTYDGFTIPIINVEEIDKINTPKNRNVNPPTI